MFRVFGIQEVNYTNKQGNAVSGLKFHMVDLDTRPNVSGNAVLEQFVSSKCDAYPVAQKVKINNNINIYYNRFGSVGSISIEEGGK